VIASLNSKQHQPFRCFAYFLEDVDFSNTPSLPNSQVRGRMLQ